ARIGRHKDERSDARHKAHAGASREVESLENFLEYGNMALVLLQRRGHAFESAPVIIPAQEFALLGDLEAGMEVLGFQQVDVQRAIHDQMIDLRHASLMLQSQVMDYCPSPGRTIVEVDVVHGLLFAAETGAAVAQVFSRAFGSLRIAGLTQAFE